MLPKDGFGFGFVLMFFSIGLSLLAKGVCLPLLLGDFRHLLTISNHHVHGVSWTFVWFCSMILPGLLLVSWLFIFLNNQKDHRVTFPKLAPNKNFETRTRKSGFSMFQVGLPWARIFCYLGFGLDWVRIRNFPFKKNSLILNFLHSNSLFCWKTLVSNVLYKWLWIIQLCSWCPDLLFGLLLAFSWLNPVINAIEQQELLSALGWLLVWPHF